MRILTLATFLALPLAAAAQRAGSYSVVAGSSSVAAYTALEPTNAPVARTAGTADEGYYNDRLIGFDFVFAGVSYDRVSISTNGFLTLGQPLTSALPANNLATGAVRPIIAPLWDDLSFGTPSAPADPTADGDLYYQLSGAPGSRALTIEWRNVRWAPDASGAVCSFLVVLLEGSNGIVFSYLGGGTAPSGTARSASVGLAGGSSGDFLSLSDLQLTATSSTTTETATISSRAASGRLFTFTPGVKLATPAPVAAASWQLAPNPAREQVRLVGHDPALAITLLDGQGRLVRTLAPAAEAVLDLRGLAAGLYVVRAGAQTRHLVVE